MEAFNKDVYPIHEWKYDDVTDELSVTLAIPNESKGISGITFHELQILFGAPPIAIAVSQGPNVTIGTSEMEMPDRIGTRTTTVYHTADSIEVTISDVHGWQ